MLLECECPDARQNLTGISREDENMTELSDLAITLRRAYFRNYKKSHKRRKTPTAKKTEYNNRYWEKKADLLAAAAAQGNPEKVLDTIGVKITDLAPKRLQKETKKSTSDGKTPF